MANVNVIARATGLRKIDGMIKTVSKAYGSVQSRVQECALLILEHAHNYGDCTRAAKLARAVPARERNSLISWFKHVSPIGIRIADKEADDQARFIKPDSRDYVDFDMEKAKSHMWWDDTWNENRIPPPLNTLADFWDQVDRLIERTLKAAEAEGKEAKYKASDRPKVMEAATKLRQATSELRTEYLKAISNEKPEREPAKPKGRRGGRRVAKRPVAQAEAA